VAAVVTILIMIRLTILICGSPILAGRKSLMDRPFEGPFGIKKSTRTKLVSLISS
jgi:hypothetical protein